jgi:hypothetical protein
MKKYVFATIQFPIEITKYGTKTHMDRFIVKITDCDELPPVNTNTSLEQEIQKIISKSNELNVESDTSDSITDTTDSEYVSKDVSEIEAKPNENISSSPSEKTPEPEPDPPTHIILKTEIKHPKHILQNQTFKIQKKKNNISHKKR